MDGTPKAYITERMNAFVEKVIFGIRIVHTPLLARVRMTKEL